VQKIIGYITWDSTPTVGTAHGVHRLSFIDVLTGTSMSFPPEEIIVQQFIIAGKVASRLIESLPMFTPRKPKPDGSPWKANIKDEPDITILGTLARWPILSDPAPEMEDKLLLIAPKPGGVDKVFEVTITGQFADAILNPQEGPRS